MDNLINYATTHQFTIAVALFVLLLVVYVTFKKLLKLALLLTLMLVAVGGYMYFKDPGKGASNIQDTFRKAKEQTGRVVEKGKRVYGKGKAIAEKGASFSKDLKEVMKDEKGDKAPTRER